MFKIPKKNLGRGSPSPSPNPSRFFSGFALDSGFARFGPPNIWSVVAISARRHTSHVTRSLPRSLSTTTESEIIMKQQHCKWRRSTFNPSIERSALFTILSRITIYRFWRLRKYGTRHRRTSPCCVPSHRVSTSSIGRDQTPTPRPDRRKPTTAGWRFFYSDRFTGKRLNLGFSPTTFELLACSCRSASTIFTQVIIYRPGSDQVTDKFYDEITTLLESVATFQSEVIISGDFNIHVDDSNDRHGRRLLDILDSFDMVQIISAPTHKGGHTLDLIITRRNSPPRGFRVDPPVYSDHGLTLCAFPPVNFAVRHRSKDVRFWKRLDRESFRQSLLNSRLCDGAEALSTMSPAALFDLYDGTLRRIVDEHLPVENISVRDRPLTPWYENDCRTAKRKVMMCERRYRRTRSEMDCMAWIREMERKRNLLERKEESFWNAKIASNAGNSKKLWSVLNSLQRKDRIIPPSTSDISAETLSGFFQDKVRAVRDDTATADEPTFTKLVDWCILHRFSALLHGRGSEIPHSFPAEVLFTGPRAYVHPTGVPRRVAPVHLHHVQRFPSTRSAPWITEGNYRHTNPQEAWSWSRRRQELSSNF